MCGHASYCGLRCCPDWVLFIEAVQQAGAGEGQVRLPSVASPYNADCERSFIMRVHPREGGTSIVAI